MADTPDGERIVAGCWGHRDELLTEGVANARLIAASPLLLDALTWAVEWMERYEGEVMPEWREWTDRGRVALTAARPPQAPAAGRTDDDGGA